MCPSCSSDAIDVYEYDYGRCSETGYVDAGVAFRCHACGAKGDADDLISARSECGPTIDAVHNGIQHADVSGPSRDACMSASK